MMKPKNQNNHYHVTEWPQIGTFLSRHYFLFCFWHVTVKMNHNKSQSQNLIRRKQQKRVRQPFRAGSVAVGNCCSLEKRTSRQWRRALKSTGRRAWPTRPHALSPYRRALTPRRRPTHDRATECLIWLHVAVDFCEYWSLKSLAF